MSNPTVEKTLDEQVTDILHRVRTRSLRDAPIYLSHVNEVEHDIKALIASETRLARVKAEREVRGDYLFMMNTHAFGRPFSYEKVLQVTKDAYSELEAELASLKANKSGEE